MIQTWDIAAGTVALPIVPNTGQTDRLSLVNSGSADVLVSDLPNGSGFPLSPGDLLTWDSGKPLYVSAVAKTRLIVVDNGGQYSSTRAVAQAMIDLGLPQQIADDIVASNLSNAIATDLTASGLSNAIAAQVAVQGAPGYDIGYTFLSGTTLAPQGSSWTSGYADVGKYKSIQIETVTTGQTGALANTPIGFPVLKVEWASVNFPGIGVARTLEFITMDNGVAGQAATMTVQIPVQESWVQFSIASVPALAVGTQVSVNVFGSTQDPNRILYVNNPPAQYQTPQLGIGVTSEDGGLYLAGNVAVGTLNLYPTTRSGRARLYYSAGTVVTAALTLVITRADNTALDLYRVVLPVLGTVQSNALDLVLPSAPIRVVVSAAGTATAFRLALNWDE